MHLCGLLLVINCSVFNNAGMMDLCWAMNALAIYLPNVVCEQTNVLAKALKMNVFFEDQESKTELNVIFERAMESLGRRPDKLPRN